MERVGAVGALVLVVAGAVSQEAVDLPAQVLGLTGGSPRECGRFEIREVAGKRVAATRGELDAAVRCARQAIRDRQPFWTFVERRGIDSWIAHGLLRTAGGDLRFFVYDAAPCGGPHCQPTLSLEPCREPAVKPAAEGGEADFSCR
jgi:hypothetical protein